MERLNFTPFANAVEAQVSKLFDMAIQKKAVLVRVALSNDDMIGQYLAFYPKEVNGIFREREYYNGNYDKNFIARLGSVVAIDENLNLHTVWDVEADGYYQDVANLMRKLVLENSRVSEFFLTTEKVAGSLPNEDNYPNPNGGKPIIWNHFYSKVPNDFIRSNATEVKGQWMSSAQTFIRALRELDTGSLETVLELAESNNIYRGSEHVPLLKSFLKAKRDVDGLNEEQLTRYAYLSVYTKPDFGSLYHFRNSVIGTLVCDVADGVELNKAVASFESKVAPQNYKRTSAVVTPRMVEEAKKTVYELGLEDALARRTATIKDIPPHQVLHMSQKAKDVFADSFDSLKEEVRTPQKVEDLKNIKTVSMKDFIDNVLPSAKSVELLLEGRLKSNMMTLLTAQHASAPLLFKWGNPFSWSYNGEVADAITERVKNAGGTVDADFRVSLSWHSATDLDLHCKTPRDEIYFGNRRECGLHLDLDMNGIDKHDSENPVENIYAKHLSDVSDGEYKFFVHNFNERGGQKDFIVQVYLNGMVYNFKHSGLKYKSHSAPIVVVKKGNTLSLKSDKVDGFTATELVSDIYGLKTCQFVPVQYVMRSPNHWDEETGNLHYFFILDGAKTNEKQRGYYNEFLKEELMKHRKVFELLAGKTKVEPSDDQLSGVGLSSTVNNYVYLRVTGKTKRVFRVEI